MAQSAARSVSGIGNIPELRRRIIFTLLMLLVYRFGVFVSTPGIDVEALRQMIDTSAGTLFGIVNMFSGGALENFSIFTLGITPYISVSIIMQLLATMVPQLEALKKEGEAGQRVITRYTRQGTVVLALFQSYVIAMGLEEQPGLVPNPGLQFRLTTMATLTTGTAFIMWLGEQISERGIGNGMSVVIFAGILARMPASFIAALELAREGEVNPLSVLFVLGFTGVTIAAIVFVERSARKIPIQYPRRMVGRNVAQAQTQYLPLKVNLTGVIPPIFASSFLVVPGAILSFSGSETAKEILSYFSQGKVGYDLLFVALVIAFSYFYIGVQYNPVDMADQLKKNSGFVPQVRPGKETAQYFYGILNRLALWGGIYISIVCIVPDLVYRALGVDTFSQVFGGTAILIVVGVTLEIFSQIESYIVARNYEAFMSRTAKSQAGMGQIFQGRQKLLRR